MGSAADWYARKLGGGGAVAAPGRPSYPATERAMPVQPRGVASVQVQPGTMAVQTEDDDLVEKPGWSHVLAGKLVWKGGRGTKTETNTCPNCGSGFFFSRKENAKMTQNGPVLPAPLCDECGYNGVYYPFGGDLNSVL